MFRPITHNDRDIILSLMKEFYRSPAVLHPIPEENFQKTVDEVLGGSPYADCYLFLDGQEIAGYALLAKTYSNEAGGLVVWVEEVYIREACRGKGFGGAFLTFLDYDYPQKIVRIRLEVSEENARAMRLYERYGYRRFDYLQMIKE